MTRLWGRRDPTLLLSLFFQEFPVVHIVLLYLLSDSLLFLDKVIEVDLPNSSLFIIMLFLSHVPHAFILHLPKEHVFDIIVALFWTFDASFRLITLLNVQLHLITLDLHIFLMSSCIHALYYTIGHAVHECLGPILSCLDLSWTVFFLFRQHLSIVFPLLDVLETLDLQIIKSSLLHLLVFLEHLE